MWTTILELLDQLFIFLNKTFPKYFPPKSTQTKIDEGSNDVQKEADKIRNDGRP